MSRIINLGAAQMGPIAPDESRESCVSRMVDLIKQASSRGCSFVVFPELALTTFFQGIMKKIFPKWMIGTRKKCLTKQRFRYLKQQPMRK